MCIMKWWKTKCSFNAQLFINTKHSLKYESPKLVLKHDFNVKFLVCPLV